MGADGEDGLIGEMELVVVERRGERGHQASPAGLGLVDQPVYNSDFKPTDYKVLEFKFEAVVLGYLDPRWDGKTTELQKSQD